MYIYIPETHCFFFSSAYIHVDCRESYMDEYGYKRLMLYIRGHEADRVTVDASRMMSFFYSKMYEDCSGFEFVLNYVRKIDLLL